MKVYKLWIEIEEHDTETGDIVDITRSTGQADPVPLGVVSSLHMATQKAEGLYNYLGVLENND